MLLLLQGGKDLCLSAAPLLQPEELRFRQRIDSGRALGNPGIKTFNPGIQFIDNRSIPAKQVVLRLVDCILDLANIRMSRSKFDQEFLLSGPQFGEAK